MRQAVASSVSSLQVARDAECGLREASVAVLVQRAVATDLLVVLARGERGTHLAGPERSFRVSVLSRGGARSLSGTIVLEALSLDGSGDLEPGAREVAAHLGTDGLARLAGVLDAVEAELGRRAVVTVALGAKGSSELHVVAAEPDASQRANETEPGWLELSPGRCGARPIGELSRALFAVAAERAVVASLHALGASQDEPRQLVRTTAGRTYLGVDAVLAATHDLPGLRPVDVLSAIGTGSAEALHELARRRGGTKRRLRGAMHASVLAIRQVEGERESSRLERELQRDVRALGELDLGLLPTDAIATTLLRVEELMGRAVELWGRRIAAQFTVLLSLGATLGRRGSERDLATACLVTSGAGGTFGASMTSALARVVDVVRADASARAALEAGVSRVEELPDGPARGALGQFLSSYGDVASCPFDLEVPRWREAPRTVFDRVVEWLAREGSARLAVEVAQERVRARADAELAHDEPELGWTERSLVRFLVERGRRLARERASLDRLVLRVLALARAVADDADRRLRRIDPSMRRGAVFACSFDRVVAAFRSGRPELASLVALRDHEAATQRREGAPPASFFGNLAPSTRFVVGVDGRHGIGVGAGVVDGRVRLAESHGGGGAPGIVVARALDVAALPECFLAGGVLAETGGVLAPCAEALRELGIPAVFSVEALEAALAPGELVRIDGTRGLVQRLAGRGAPDRS
jgi:phosphohistidine swiveling domain-containing protein